MRKAIITSPDLRPGVAGPLLVKNEGLASWRIERPGGHATQTPASTSGTAQAPTYLLPDDARSLTKAEASTDGLRYNKLKQTFVDTAEGTVRVRKNPEGQYQQAFATTHEAPEIFSSEFPTACCGVKKPQIRHPMSRLISSACAMSMNPPPLRGRASDRVWTSRHRRPQLQNPLHPRPIPGYRGAT